MATNETIPSYNSDSEEDDTISTIVNSKRKSKRERNWALEKVFSNIKDALEFIDLENTWSLHYKNETAEGNKSYFRCNKAKSRANACPAGIYLLFDSRNEDVILFQTRENHEHNGLEERSGLSDNAKKEIKKLLDLRQKPKQILATLREKAIPIYIDRHFHSFGIRVCSNEKTADFIFIFETLVKTLEILGVTFNIDTLISDASEAIRNAFIAVFGESVIIIMCWAHVRRNVVKQLHLVDEMYSVVVSSPL